MFTSGRKVLWRFFCLSAAAAVSFSSVSSVANAGEVEAPVGGLDRPAQQSCVFAPGRPTQQGSNLFAAGTATGCPGSTNIEICIANDINNAPDVTYKCGGRGADGVYRAGPTVCPPIPDDYQIYSFMQDEQGFYVDSARVTLCT